MPEGVFFVPEGLFFVPGGGRQEQEAVSLPVGLLEDPLIG